MATIRYIGSKLSLIDWLLVAFDLEHIKSFADPMCGTGVVSEAVARSGIKVFANDICSYASILAASRVVPFNQLLYDSYFKKFAEIAGENELDGNGFVYMNYAPHGANGNAETGSDRLYFTGENAKKIDACRILIEKTTDLDIDTKNALIATILISADKVANTASVYGAFLKHIKKTAAQSIIFQRILSSTTSFTNTIANGDAILFLTSLSEKVDLVYIDPPYTNRGYCSNYHVLETIALYDNPTIRGITGLRHDCLKKNSNTSKNQPVFIIINS